MKLLIYLLAIVQIVGSVETNLNKIPNSSYVKTGSKSECQICHEHSSPSFSTSARNPFGRDFATYGRTWNSNLGNTDSDNDGFSNAAELQCHNFSWISGVCGTNYMSATNPGDPDISPSTKAEQSTEIENYGITAHPNPFNPFTSIRFTIPERSTKVSLSIINSKGNVVKTINTVFQGSGFAYWDGTNNEGTNVSAGIYTAIITNARSTYAIKLSLIR